MTASEFMRTDNVNEIQEATEVVVLDDEVAAIGLAWVLPTSSVCPTSVERLELASGNHDSDRQRKSVELAR